MGKAILYETSYPEALKALAAELRGKKFSFDEYYIVLTPDRYTLQVEKALFSGRGSINCEVLTLSRLCRRLKVCDNNQTLSTEGAVMLTACAAEEAENLEYYGAAAKYPEFAREVYAALIQISLSGADIDDLIASVPQSSLTGKKLRDLKKIKEKYDEKRKDLCDSTDRLKALAGAIPTLDSAKKTHFYAIGYSDATELIGEVFCAIKDNARLLSVYGAVPPSVKKMLAPEVVKLPAPKPKEKPDVYKMSDAISQYKEAASMIRDYVYGDKTRRYGDVYIVAPNPRALTRILNEYGIDYYADASVALYDTAPFTALANIIRISTDAEADRIISLCKNPYALVDPSDADELEFILTKRGIKHDVFNADIDSKGANKALSAVKKMRDEFLSHKKFSEACSAVMETCGFEETERKIADEASAISGGDSGLVMTDAVKPIRSVLDLIDRYGTGDFKKDAFMFFSAAKALNIKSLPRFADRVSVVGVESLRLTSCELLIVVDFNEGVLPVPTADSGLLSDADIITVGKDPFGEEKIKPSAKEKNKRSREELLEVIFNAKRAVCMYVDSGQAKKAGLLSSVNRYEIADGMWVDPETGGEVSVAVAKDIPISKADKAAATSGLVHPPLQSTSDPKTIGYYACVPSAARELSARKKTSYGKAIDAALKGGESQKHTAKKFSRHVNGVVGHETLSVSELSDWFGCPYRRFLRYTVGLKERYTGEFSAPDFGTMMHKVMEEFVKKELYKKSEDEIEKSVREYARSVAEEVEFALSDLDKERFVENACDYARVNARIINAGNYKPDLYWTERKFDGDILLGKSKIRFKGKIDRVDVLEKSGEGAEQNDTRYLRVFDYKTNASKSLSQEKIKDGREMQLALYAAELISSNRNNGASKTNDGGADAESVQVTGMFYVPLPQKYVKEKRALLSGTMVKDYDVAVDYDKNIFTCGESEVLKLKSNDDRDDFSGGSKKSKTIIAENKFRELIDISVKNSDIAADQIDGGYIERSPADDKECDYCPFVGLCEHRLVRGKTDEEEVADE
ncbi:MAG: PD-(D/E)XK nuclease family protein [Clostridiales bacterium]|nr:PD-(D/E)XK nuclease family protein [Clostridiales bacterium]